MADASIRPLIEYKGFLRPYFPVIFAMALTGQGSRKIAKLLSAIGAGPDYRNGRVRDTSITALLRRWRGYSLPISERQSALLDAQERRKLFKEVLLEPITPEMIKAGFDVLAEGGNPAGPSAEVISLMFWAMCEAATK